MNVVSTSASYKKPLGENFAQSKNDFSVRFHEARYSWVATGKIRCKNLPIEKDYLIARIYYSYGRMPSNPVGIPRSGIPCKNTHPFSLTPLPYMVTSWDFFTGF